MLLNTDKDMSDIRGQQFAVACVTEAVRLRKNVLLIAPPGLGSLALASRVPTIMRPLDAAAAQEVSATYESAKLDPTPQRAFRAPHYTISLDAMCGTPRRIGELQLAEHGVLCLDELHEFPKEVIRQIGIRCREMSPESRPLIIATAKPCMCGYRGADVHRACLCSDDSRTELALRRNMFAAYLDIEFTARMPLRTLDDMRQLPPGESSASIRSRLGW